MKSVVFFPVKPHVFKFLKFKYGDSVTYSSGLSLSPVIRTAISDAEICSVSPFSTNLHYPVELSSFYLNKFDVVYSKKKAYQFNADVDTMFREELYQFMNMNHDIYGVQYNTSFRDFLKRLEITEDDIKHETLLKQFRRHYRKKEDKAA
tara:strand:+ start:1514 stop:1960 length:447 start_codon:yes stop_codon:yes gene_type:complete